MKKKNVFSVFMAGLLSVTILVSCGSPSITSSFKPQRDISVISREDGSGTRGAFIELFKIEEKDKNGNRTDHTTQEATIANKTDVMIQSVAGDPYAIGYVSLGSFSDTVKVVKIDGVEATTENVVSKSYKVTRPFIIVTKGELTGTAKDFMDFILSKEGQDVVAGSYIRVNDSAPAYTGSKSGGKVVVGGSSSVSPIMEKLKEAYLELNPNAQIEIQTSDSTSGITGTMDGIFHIGMVSRELKDSEKEILIGTQIAIDGIAVVVNPRNPVKGLISDQVKAIFTGEFTVWQDIT